jgi:hypothetical protein
MECYGVEFESDGFASTRDKFSVMYERVEFKCEGDRADCDRCQS